MNTHENYVSLETAKLLKEAGFDWNCVAHYHNGVIDNIYSEERNHNSKEYDDGGYNVYYSAPTLDIARQWLRDTHKILLDLESTMFRGWHVTIHRLSDDGKDYLEEHSHDYEEVLEYGIQKCLIKILEE